MLLTKIIFSDKYSLLDLTILISAILNQLAHVIFMSSTNCIIFSSYRI